MKTLKILAKLCMIRTFLGLCERRCARSTSEHVTGQPAMQTSMPRCPTITMFLRLSPRRALRLSYKVWTISSCFGKATSLTFRNGRILLPDFFGLLPFQLILCGTAVNADRLVAEAATYAVLCRVAEQTTEAETSQHFTRHTPCCGRRHVTQYTEVPVAICFDATITAIRPNSAHSIDHLRLES